MSGHRAGEAGTAWDPEQYARFERERAEPFHDLLAGVLPLPGGRVVDLGCGTGALTRIVHETTEAASTLGIDSSSTMLARAVPKDGLRFEQVDIGAYEPPRAFDLVFSNAALQWLPDHERLIERLAEWVAPAGQLAIQMPANHHHISHVLAATLAEEQFDCPRRRHSVLPPDEYAVLLDRAGFRQPSVRVQVYLHHLPGPDALVEWVEGTLLNAYRARLPERAFPEFLQRYREELIAALPSERPYRFTFPRILIHAHKPA